MKVKRITYYSENEKKKTMTKCFTSYIFHKLIIVVISNFKHTQQIRGVQSNVQNAVAKFVKNKEEM